MTVRPEELAAELARRRRRQLAQDQVRGARLRAELQVAVEDARRTGRLERAWLIGSLASGRFGPGSDIDLVVEGADVRDLGLLWGELTARLEAELDLLRFEGLDETFQRRILEEGERLV